MFYGRLAFVRLSVASACGALLAVVLLDAFSPVLFYALGLIAFVLGYELTATDSVDPLWRRRVRWFTVVLVLGFGVLAGYRVWQIVDTVG